ncbi:PP2C family protein-serine/threonine phosphatase [Streptomyces roseoviridis]|uniref:PP2C family protein-serine/threonine phosphatase n=1 Tax=Streptomyces roseoviridis TaxID=67361 RepID=A0ABV5QVL0_9ACTN
MTRSAGPAGTPVEASAEASAERSAAWADSAFAGLAAENRRLRAELVRRHLLDLATGVLAVQLGISTADAAEHLTALAGATGLAAEDLSADIVNAVATSGSLLTTPGDPRDRLVPEVLTAEDLPPVLGRRLRRTAAAAEIADGVAEGARTLLRGGLAPLGAESLWLWRYAEAGSLRLAGHAGVGATEAAAWWSIPPAAPAPIRAALAGNAAVWLEHGTDTDAGPLPGTGPDAARAVLPLRRRGATVGVALVCWPGPTELGTSVRRAVTGLMDVAVAVLDRPDAEEPGAPALVDVLDALVHPGALLRTHPTTGAPALDHVNEAGAAALGGALPADDRSLHHAFPHAHEELARLVRRARHTRRPQHAARLPAGRPGGAPGPLLDVRVLPAGADRSVVLWHTVGDPGVAAGRAVARLQSVATFQDSLTGGDTVWSEQAYGIFGMSRHEAPLPLLALRGRVHREDGEALTTLLRTLTERRSGAQTVLRIVLPDGAVRHVRVAAEPLLEGDTVTGFVGVYQDVSATRRTELALTATFDHLTAVRDQAELRHQLALQLQQAIVPEVTALRELPGDLAVAARYRPAAKEYQVGGDWYDVLPLPSGKVLVAVGDIAGHGIDTVTGMVSLRNAQRALAFTGSPPRQLMSWLNEVTLRTGGGATATAVCALYDPEDGGLLWSSAGHLPLLLLRDGRARLLEPPHDILLGAVPSYTYEERRTVLRPGDTLLLYTDGLVERRRDGLATGLARLVATAGRLAGRESPELLVDGLLAAALGDTDDDTSIVAVRVRRPGEAEAEARAEARAEAVPGAATGPRTGGGTGTGG